MLLARVALVDHNKNLSSVAMMTIRETALESKSIWEDRYFSILAFNILIK